MLCYGLVPQLTKLQAKETLPEEDYVLLLCSQELAAQTTMQDTEERLGELKRVRFCRVISEESGCSGSLYIPKRNAEAGHDAVCFYQHQNHIVILDDSNLMETLLERIQLQCKPVHSSATSVRAFISAFRRRPAASRKAAAAHRGYGGHTAGRQTQ